MAVLPAPPCLCREGFCCCGLKSDHPPTPAQRCMLFVGFLELRFLSGRICNRQNHVLPCLPRTCDPFFLLAGPVAGILLWKVVPYVAYTSAVCFAG